RAGRARRMRSVRCSPISIPVWRSASTSIAVCKRRRSARCCWNGWAQRSRSIDLARPRQRSRTDFAATPSTLDSAAAKEDPAMTTAVLETKATAFDVADVEYLRHGDKPLLARVYTPRGDGPFPALVECHGGAWCMSDRFSEKLRHEYMASHGIASIALDF